MAGLVPEGEWQRMRAPLQQGNFPHPVKYGYCATGVVEEGPDSLVGQIVFVLHPHQDIFIAPADMAVLVPVQIPAMRATLAANMETALNALWDSGAGPAVRIAVVGGGIVGLLVAYLATRLPGAEVVLTDINPQRSEIAASLGVSFVAPRDVAGMAADIVFHASASEAGLATALSAAGLEGSVIEMSWYGKTPVSVPLGDAFHSQRLKLISSQVGQVAPSYRPRWSYRRRMQAALRLLDDPRLDALLTTVLDFNDAPNQLPALLNNTDALAPLIRYA
jgi:threonine dehydrogenase-like Zn-dependent dehydrogenase